MLTAYCTVVSVYCAALPANHNLIVERFLQDIGLDACGAFCVCVLARHLPCAGHLGPQLVQERLLLLLLINHVAVGSLLRSQGGADTNIHAAPTHVGAHHLRVVVVLPSP